MLIEVKLLLICFSASLLLILCCLIPKKRVDYLSSALVGLVIGIVIGLSASPIIGSIFTAAFVLLGSVIPLFLKEESRNISFNVRGNIIPFCLLFIIGLLSGVIVRTNDLFNIENNLTVRYGRLGFDNDQIKTIMNDLAGNPQSIPDGSESSTHKSALLANTSNKHIKWWQFKLADNGDYKSSIDYIIDHSNEKEKEYIELLNNNIKDKKIVFELIKEMYLLMGNEE